MIMMMMMMMTMMTRKAQMVAKTVMGENHIGPGFIFLYLGARCLLRIII